MLSILQRLRGDPHEQAARALLGAVGGRARSDDLEPLLRRTAAEFPGGAGHYGLAFVLGQAHEVLAGEKSWGDRGEWFRHAVECYDRARVLALAARIEGAELVGEASPAVWPGVATKEQRAALAAAYRSGLLRVAEHRVRDVDRAIEDLRLVAAATPGRHPVWYYLGEAYNLVGRFDEAESTWRAGLAFAPDDPSLQALLANLPADRVHYQVKVGDWAGALDELARVPTGALPDAERLTIEGDAWEALGDLDGARRCWDEALARDPLAVGVRRRVRRLASDRVL